MIQAAALSGAPDEEVLAVVPEPLVSAVVEACADESAAVEACADESAAGDAEPDLSTAGVVDLGLVWLSVL